MFTLKAFHADGSYTAISCKHFRVVPGHGKEKARIHYTHDDGSGGQLVVDPRVIIENANGKTIDVIRPYGREATRAN